MPSFAQISENHPTLLIIDAASAVLQVGWAQSGAETRWIKLESEAGTGVYRALTELAENPGDANAFVFCEGPGSMLGIRTVAAALRTWVALRPRPIFSYRSLDLAALAHGEVGATFICDARRQSWHCLSLGDDLKPSKISRIPTAELPGRPLYCLNGFRSWTPLPEPKPPVVPYDAACLTGTLSSTELLRENTDPDAFQPERPDYAKWTPQVHQGPAS
ncbi:MAG: hypothetical protein SynsKO_27830 [Synoicihabitans sp.]